MADSVLSIIIVTYNSRAEIDACLKSLFADLGGLPAQVIVADNASADGTAEHIAEVWRQVTLLAQTCNRGFAVANNLGIQRARGDRILFLNPDAIVQSGAISALLAAMDAHPDAGIVGPRLLNPDASLQPSCREFPSLLTHFIGMTELYRVRFVRQCLARWFASLGDHGFARRVDWLSGACLLVRRAAIDAVGLMDEGFFLYAEELEWQYRMARRGWSAWFEPSARVLHLGGASTAAVPGQRIVWQYESIYRFYRIHRRAYQRLGLRILVWLVTLPKILILTLMSRGNPRRQELLRAFWQVLWLR